MTTEPKRDNENPDTEGSFAEQIDADEQLENALNAAGTGQPQEENPDAGRVKALEEELAASKDQTLRALAELENFRKRAVKEREDAGKYAVSKFARDLLDVADNLRRAMEAFPEESKQDIKVANLLEGLEATEKEMLKSFEKNGIEKLEPLNEPFDPNFHEVMFEAPDPTKAPGTVLQVIETGYTLNGRILRPARVGVVKDDGQSGLRPGSGNDHPGGNVDTQA